MRVCPNCGHADHDMWRPRNSRVFCNFTKAETLEYNDPNLFKKVREVHPEYYFDGHYLYHITRTGLNVERIEKEYYDLMGWGRDGEPEKIDHGGPVKTDDSPSFTRKLTEYGQSSNGEF